MQLIKLHISDSNVILINLYAPNNDDVNFYNSLENTIKDYEDETLIIGGDFNTVLDYSFDKLNGRDNSNHKTSNKINNIIVNYDLSDIFRTKNPTAKVYTWHSNTHPPIFCRLDYFLISNNILNAVSDCQIHPGYRSDHSIVKMILNTNTQERGPGYFKLNNSYAVFYA